MKGEFFAVTRMFARRPSFVGSKKTKRERTGRETTVEVGRRRRDAYGTMTQYPVDGERTTDKTPRGKEPNGRGKNGTCLWSYSKARSGDRANSFALPFWKGWEGKSRGVGRAECSGFAIDSQPQSHRGHRA